MPGSAPRIAVVGAGWAGLAAAVQATRQRARVTLFEMARDPGGRARQARAAGTGPVDGDPLSPLDNGQHILIGAYSATLALMREVGAQPQQLLWRGPLSLRYPDGSGLQLPEGRPALAFARGVVSARGWSWTDKRALLGWAVGRWLHRFECDEATTVASLCQGLTPRIRRDLVEPLCVAALNTPMDQASGRVFLRVLHDALLGGRGSADLLLPRAPLSALLPGPALAWLAGAGADCRLGQRVRQLTSSGAGWAVDGEPFDAVVLACSAVEAARLARPTDPGWADTAARLRYEPIVTAWLTDASLRLPQPMTALRAGPDDPAQYLFDLGLLGVAPQTFAFVVSGAAPWLALGLDRTADAVVAQARRAFPGGFAQDQPLRHIAAERRATFACTPGLSRPPMALAPGLLAAGDYIAGPYPATLEGAVRSGRAAAQALA